MKQDKQIEKLEQQIKKQQDIITQYEREIFYLTKIVEEKNRRVNELEAKGYGKKRRRGRPNLSDEQKSRILELVKEGNSYRKIHELTGASLGAISGVVKQMEESE